MNQQESHTQKVKSFFEVPERYLERRKFDIRIRSETVHEFTKGEKIENVIDIGCGDGSISLPLLTASQSQTLTLLDLSSSMLALVKDKITENLLPRAKFINEDFLVTELDPKGYDLVLCLGILAHADSPEDVIAKISNILKPKGILILEVSDGHHFVGQIYSLYNYISAIFKPGNRHKLNRLRTDEIVSICIRHGLIPANSYRYSLPPPGSYRFFNQQTLYKMTRVLFGDLENNRNRQFGNVSIYRFDKQES